jgi:hypothetical protein
MQVRIDQGHSRQHANLLAARWLEDTPLTERFAHIHRRQMELGHLPHDLYEARHKAYQDLLVAAKAALDEPTYQKLYMSF